MREEYEAKLDDMRSELDALNPEDFGSMDEYESARDDLEIEIDALESFLGY